MTPKATEGCMVFFSGNLSLTLYQAHPYSQPNCKLDKQGERPPYSHGHIQWSQTSSFAGLCLQRHMVLLRAQLRPKDLEERMLKHGWPPQGGGAVDLSCWA